MWWFSQLLGESHPTGTSIWFLSSFMYVFIVFYFIIENTISKHSLSREECPAFVTTQWEEKLRENIRYDNWD